MSNYIFILHYPEPPTRGINCLYMESFYTKIATVHRKGGEHTRDPPRLGKLSPCPLVHAHLFSSDDGHHVALCTSHFLPPAGQEKTEDAAARGPAEILGLAGGLACT
jgi:hypothetical protein